MSSKIPRAVQLPAETKKTGHKLESRDAISANTQKPDGILKPQKENVLRKNVAPKVHKGISTRYRQQAELKGQNQHLMATNEELQKNLTETQQRVADLELQCSVLEKENAEVQKNLKDCHILLVTANIDPVSGERVGEAARQNEAQRKEVMVPLSLLALYSLHSRAMSSKIPRDVQLPAETKKTGHKLESRDAISANTQKPDGILKPQKENVLRKNVAPKVHKGISTRYGQQAELKGQNQHLMATNEELQKNLTETQQRVADLELQCSGLEKENAEVQKNLKDCHILLVTANIDPVSGERVGEAARQNEAQRKEVMSVSTDLLNEIKAFGDTASQQRARLEEIQTTMTELAKAREHMMKERETFSIEAAEIEKTLQESEALLNNFPI